MGAQPWVLQLWLRKARKNSASRSLAMVLAHLVGAAPASSSSHRGQPFVFLPNTTPPQVCFVVVDLVHAMILFLFNILTKLSVPLM
jgi:hypothetical protein